MQASHLFASLRRTLRDQLVNSGAEFGAVEIRHGFLQQETTVIIYTDLGTQFRLIPKVMEGVDGLVDFKVGHDQIWICSNKPVRLQVHDLTSHRHTPLRVLVDVCPGGENRTVINVLVPRGMRVAKLATVVDTRSLYRSTESELPAMSMVSPLFDTVSQQREPQNSIEAMMTELADSLRGTLGPGHRVEMVIKQLRSGGIGSIFRHLLGHKAEEEWPLSPGVRQDGDMYTVTGASEEEVAEKLRRMLATKPANVELRPLDPLAAEIMKDAAATSGASQSGSYPVPDDAALLHLWQTAPDEQMLDLLHKDCDGCHKRGRCSNEMFTRASQRVLGITPGSRHGGVTADPWDVFGLLNRMYGGTLRKAREAVVCDSCSMRDVCGQSASQVRMCQETVQANQSQPVAEPAAETADAGEQPAQDTVVATTTDGTVTDPAEKSAEAPVTDESAATGVAEAQVPASSDGSAS